MTSEVVRNPGMHISSSIPKHVEKWRSNIGEVRRLIRIHEQLGGVRPGFRHNLEVLNKSCIVLLVACWEAYIEELARQSVNEMMLRLKEPLQVPGKVRGLVAHKIKDNANPNEIWNLAGDGWKAVLITHKDIVLRSIADLHTPNSKNVDELFEKLIGLPHISESWVWRGVSNSKAKHSLLELIEMRGNIAHQVAAGKKVHKQLVLNRIALLRHLACLSHNCANKYIHDLTGDRPWKMYKLPERRSR